MVRCSNTIVGIINSISFILSIAILGIGIWLRVKALSGCDQFLSIPIIILGAFLMLVSIAGIFGACCRVRWLLWLYLFVMFVLVIILFCFTIFMFVVTSKGDGDLLEGKAYKEYRLDNYSKWLQMLVRSGKNWMELNKCLVPVCNLYKLTTLAKSEADFNALKLNPIESGCCKPSNDCEFKFVTPTNWTKTDKPQTNVDCQRWDNDPENLCYGCDSCKAGLLDVFKSAWRKVAVANIVVLVFLLITYSIGCCAVRNNRTDSYGYSYYGSS